MKSFREIAAAAFHLAKPLTGDGAHLDVEQLRGEMAACIEGRGGDIATRNRTMQIGARYAIEWARTQPFLGRILGNPPAPYPRPRAAPSYRVRRHNLRCNARRAP